MRLSASVASEDGPLPMSMNLESSYPSEDDPLLAFGFGVTEEGGSSQYLRMAEMQYINNTECVDRMNAFGNLNLPNLPEEFLCTSSDSGVSVCDGDSGGPITDLNASPLVGIVSFGSGCS